MALGELEERTQLKGKPRDGSLSNDSLPSTSAAGRWQQSGLRAAKATLAPL